MEKEDAVSDQERGENKKDTREKGGVDNDGRDQEMEGKAIWIKFEMTMRHTHHLHSK